MWPLSAALVALAVVVTAVLVTARSYTDDRLRQRIVDELADRLDDGAPAKIEDVQQLVRLSLSAMEHFNVFTRELAAVLRELTDAQRHSH